MARAFFVALSPEECRQLVATDVARGAAGDERQQRQLFASAGQLLDVRGVEQPQTP